MWQRFTERARRVVFYAQEEAHKHGDSYVDTTHLLLGLLRDQDTVAVRVIESLGCSAHKLREAVEKGIGPAKEDSTADMTLTPRAKRTVDMAYDEARSLGNNYLGTEHLLLGLIRDDSSDAGKIFANAGITLEAARKWVMEAQARKAQEAQATTPPDRLPAPEPETLFSLLGGRCIKEHLMLVLIGDEEGLPGRIIRRQCEDILGLQRALWKSIADDSMLGIGPVEPTTLSDLLEVARTESGGEVRGEHLLVALLRDGGSVGRLLREAGLTVAGSRVLVKEGD